MNKLMKVMLFSLSMVMLTSLSFAQGIKEKLAASPEAQYVLHTVLEEMHKNTDAKDYIEDLENALFDAGTEHLNPRLSYTSLQRVTARPDNMREEDKALPRYILGDLTDIFLEATGYLDTAEASMEDCREFYDAIVELSSQEGVARAFVLPTIAIWRKETIRGILPFRLSVMKHFFEIPRLAGHMYNTMASINHEDAKKFFMENIDADFSRGMPDKSNWNFVEKRTEIEQDVANADQLRTFFVQFAKAGGYAAQDAGRLEEHTIDAYFNPRTDDEDDGATAEETKKIDERVRNAFAKAGK